MKKRLTISVDEEAYEAAEAIAKERSSNMSQVFQNAVLAAHPRYELTAILGEGGQDALQVIVDGDPVAYVRFAKRDILASVDATIMTTGYGRPKLHAVARALAGNLPASTVRSGTPVSFTAGPIRVTITDFPIGDDDRPEVLEQYMRRAGKRLGALSQCLTALAKEPACPTCGRAAKSISVWAPDRVITATELTCPVNHQWEP